MSRIVSPPRNQLHKLRQSLTRGEKLVFELFDTCLDEEWEIYIQPHLNGLRPDFVLLHPSVGIGVFEIKDWNLDAMDYFVEEKPGKRPILKATKDGETFPLQKENPVEKVRRYKQEIYDLYCPRLDHKLGLAVITAGVIFPFAEDKRVKELFSPIREYLGIHDWDSYYPISGQKAVNSKNIESVFPEGLRESSNYMNPELAKDLRNWLVEPDFAATQRRPLKIDDTQKSYITSRTESGYRRIKGPAGSGKSVVLAARAAQLSSEGKRVLVVSYNITLVHYLRDLAVRWPEPGSSSMDNITWFNFHYWCKRVCSEAGEKSKYDEIWKAYLDKEKNSSAKESDVAAELEEILNYRIPQLAKFVLDNDYHKDVERYDAILVDEGQDYLPEWWDVLRRACKDNGEMLLVADATQDIYGTSDSWTDQAMKGAGFTGLWAELKVSYRLPPKLVPYVKNYAEIFLPEETVDLPESPQGKLDIYPCRLRWVQTSSERGIDVCCEEILALAPSVDPDVLAMSDISFLTTHQTLGNGLIHRLGKKRINCIHTFADDSRESRRKKMGFFMGGASIKATTLHCFKGWETRALVLFIGHAIDTRSLAAAYSGMTRLKRNVNGSYLTVVCAAQELEQYGRTWPEFESVRHEPEVRTRAYFS